MNDFVMQISQIYGKDEIKKIIDHMWCQRKENMVVLKIIRASIGLCALEGIICFVAFFRLHNIMGEIITAFLIVISILSIVYTQTCAYYVFLLKQKLNKRPISVAIFLYQYEIVLCNNITGKTICSSIEQSVIWESKNVIDFNGTLWIIKEKLTTEQLEQLRIYVKTHNVNNTLF